MKNLNHRNGIMLEGDCFPRSGFLSAFDTKAGYSYHRFYASRAAMR